MKIGIITQPLISNYGGFLQAWALQEQLRKMGHEPVTVDYIQKVTPCYRLLLSWMKTLLLCCMGKPRKFTKVNFKIQRDELFDNFVRKNMSMTQKVYKYESKLINQYDFNAVISGSDQVWRPRYNRYLEDMFLRFVNQSDVKKIAYAASFGVDTWEYNGKQAKDCSRLLKQFNAVSVRENSGIALCNNCLGVDAVEVLDPTLLHTADDYEKLCVDVPHTSEPYLASYVLDITPEKQQFIENIAEQQGLSVRMFFAEDNAELSIEQWLAFYRDSQYVITDSFHGTVFSILFQKPFVSIVNSARGASRFNSLLSKFGLENRLYDGSKSINKVLCASIDWENVNLIRRQWQEKSIQFLIDVLK